MDLWDVAKLLWRRKWLSLPLVLLTMYLAAYLAVTMDPDYKTTGHVVLLAPTESKPTTPGATGPVTSSPWTVWSMSDALVIYLQRADIKGQFAAVGLSEEWTASVGGSGNPIVELEVVAHSQQQANDTLTRLVSVMNAKIADMQSPYGIQGREGITGQGVDIGQNFEVVTSKVKRAVIVVIAVGLIVTAGLTIWLDAILRRRARRRGEGTLAPMSPPVTTPRAPMAPAGASTETLALTTGGAGSGPERRAYDLDATQVGPRTMAAGPVSSANWSRAGHRDQPPARGGLHDHPAVVPQAVER